MTASGTGTTGSGHAVPIEPVLVPERGRGQRARQRRRRQRRRRARWLAVLVAVAAVAGGVAYLLEPDGGAARRPRLAAPGPPPGAAALAPVLLAQQDPSGRASALTVLAPAGGGGGTVILIPPGTMTEVVSLGLEPVGRSLELGGAPRLQATVENLLGVGLGAVAVVDDAALAAMLGPLGPLAVHVPERVEQVAPNGRVEVLWEAGPASVAPADAARFLSAKGRATDLARLARHQAFVDAWLAAVRARPDAAPTQPAALAQAFDGLVGGRIRTRVLPVEAFGTAGADGELYKVRAAELARMVEEAFPGATAGATAARPRVQILNGTGAVGLAERVRAKLGPGFDVRLTGNAATFDRQATEVVFYDRARQPVAQRVRDALGVGTLVFARRPLDVVDVTVIVGKDFNPA